MCPAAGFVRVADLACKAMLHNASNVRNDGLLRSVVVGCRAVTLGRLCYVAEFGGGELSEGAIDKAPEGTRRKSRSLTS